MNKEYLYGASVQGIQSYIFGTNKLQEIVGASELVKDVCGGLFENVAGPNADIIIAAAGNIKCYVDEDTAKKIVKTFPKTVDAKAPGLVLSQAVVKTTDDIKDDIDKLEKKLRAQRNRASMPTDIGFMGLDRARRTGGVAYKVRDKEIIDRGSNAKLDRDSISIFKDFKENIKDGKDPRITNDFNKIGTGDKSWIAVVHADGNGIGKIIQGIAAIEGNDGQEAFKKFSKNLDEATKKAAKEAFELVIEPTLNGDNKIYPFRPIILGGDDLTVVVRADLAFDFTVAYLKAFEMHTKKELAFLKDENKINGFENGLTACGGIAYIKKSYPFHYGVHLAEALVKNAKKLSKDTEKFPNNTPSSLAFYKVQSSFTDALEDMRKKTHFAKAADVDFAKAADVDVAKAADVDVAKAADVDVAKAADVDVAKAVDFDFGPYLIHEKGDFPNVKQLEEKLNVFKKSPDDPGVSKLRQWVSELYKDKNKADFMLSRMKTINAQLYKALKLDEIIKEVEVKKDGDKVKVNKSIILDVLHLQSFPKPKNKSK